MEGPCEQGNDNSGSIKNGYFLHRTPLYNATLTSTFFSISDHSTPSSFHYVAILGDLYTKQSSICKDNKAKSEYICSEL